MRKGTILFPPTTDLEDVFNFSRRLDDCSKYDSLVIDCGPERYFPPFSLMFISAKIRDFKNRNPHIEIYFQNEHLHHYASLMHFFNMCGYRGEIKHAPEDKSKRYISITSVRMEQLINNPADKYKEIGDLVQYHVDDIAEMLTRDERRSSDIFNVLSYSVREIFRNVFEHSNSGELFYCAQYWKTKNKVEVSICDLGVGIKRGLGLNPNFRFSTDKEAVEYSLLPGVSGRTHLPRTSDNWHNSGYGLYMTQRFARHGGNFVIASGNYGVGLARTSKRNFRVSFSGTAIRLNFDVNKIGDVQKRLSEFREEGQVVASKIQGSSGRPPSAMSLMLRRDFKD